MDEQMHLPSKMFLIVLPYAIINVCPTISILIDYLMSYTIWLGRFDLHHKKTNFIYIKSYTGVTFVWICQALKINEQSILLETVFSL